jgi:hypothetical protein
MPQLFLHMWMDRPVRWQTAIFGARFEKENMEILHI